MLPPRTGATKGRCLPLPPFLQFFRRAVRARAPGGRRKGNVMAPLPAKLALEDGTVYTGRAFGAPGETCGEVVFNTSMTGYQEVLTDPSYTGQIVTMTYPLIGNYGTNPEDQESRGIQVAGFIVRELTRTP